MKTCDRCGRESDDGFSFCPACGAPLRGDARTDARRTVTIVFTDIVGSTELGESLDAERLQMVLGRYIDAMRTVIERHGGTVAKFIGDAVMAVFGIPNVREDDALRAVRAAAGMRDALQVLNVDLLATHGVEIHVRTGVNTGEVVVTDAMTEEMLASGDPVNVAARFEQAAAPGEIVIGDPTYRLVRDAILAEPLEPLVLKGKAEPLPAYRVVKVDPHAAGFARRLDAPMVGRQRELSLLIGAFERTMTDHACHLFTVLGVGGVGKSRLLEAFVSELGDAATVLRGRCLAYGDGITFLPIVEAVRQAALLNGSEDPDEARGRIKALAGADEDADRISEQVAQILGIAGGEATHEETLWAIRRLFEAMARERPVVLLLDDIQWAEATLLHLIEYIADWSIDAPILLACMARPELLDERPDWSGGKLNSTSISLEPLSEEECGTLVANLLAVETVAPEVRERIAAAAEGHPLFAEELLAMLVDEGRVQLIDDVWTSSTDLGELAVPPTTSALLAARLDRLDPADRRVLERASVIGQVFYRDALEKLAEDPDVGGRLALLMRRQFVRPERSDIVDAEAIAFRHLLIRDVAYDGLTKATRADLHRRFGDWLEERAPEREELIGYHYERAVLYLAEIGAGDATDLAARAAGYLRSAGDQAFARGDMPATGTLLSRAAALMSPDDPALIDLLSSLMQALTEMGEIDGSHDVAERVVRIAEASGDELAVARARGNVDMIMFWGHAAGDLHAIEAGARARLPLFERSGDAAGAATSWAVLGGLSWGRCQARQAETAWRRAIDLFRAAGNRWLESEYLAWLSSAPAWGPTPCETALRELEALAEEARGSPSAELDVAASVGTVLMMLGDLDGARARFEACGQRMRELGRTLPLAHSSQQLGLLELLSGRAAEAEAILGPSSRTLEQMGSDALSIISAFHAEALYALGRYDEADDAAVKAAAFEDTSSTTIGLSVRGMVAARRGDMSEAEDLARRAIATIDETDFIVDRADARSALAEVLELAGRIEEATAVARDALTLYEEKGNVLQAGHARARLDRLTG